MQGNCQNKLLEFRTECSNAIENAARRNRNVACANIEPVFAIQETKGCKGIAVIQKRFPLTHDNHVAYAGAHIVLSDQYLLDNFSGKQIARESLFTCGVKRERHRASDLRRNAYRKAIARRHGNHFRRAAIGISNDVFPRAVTRNLPIVDFRTIQRGSFGELRTHVFREIRHFIIRDSSFLIEPLLDLLRAECGHAGAFHKLGKAFP